MTNEVKETFLKTLTMKAIGNNIPVGGGGYLGKVVMAVHGMVSGYTIKSTNYGESVALQGQFEAINPDTGEMFTAVVAYLPADFAEMIAKKCDNRKDASEEVEFSAQISVAASEKAARGYTFVAEPIQTVEVYNRRREFLSQMRSKLQSALPDYGQAKLALEDKSKEGKKGKAA